jgi:ABC-2 type transport system permease protein
MMDDAARTAGSAAEGRHRLGLRLLGSELGLVFRRPRNVAALVLLALVPVLIGTVIRLFGSDDGGGRGPSFITQVAGNGLFLTFASLLVLLTVLLPIVVAVVSGDSIAGEANRGTLRYLLTAPAGRTRLLVVKYASVVVFCLAAALVVAVSALVVGLLLFPAGPITLLSGSTIPFTAGLLRVVLVVAYVTAGLAALGAVGLAISTLTEAPIGAIAVTAGAVVVTQVLQAIPQLSGLQPYLLPHWWTAFDGVLRAPMALEGMGQGLLVFGAYILIFGTFAWARFTSRDISC